MVSAVSVSRSASLVDSVCEEHTAEAFQTLRNEEGHYLAHCPSWHDLTTGRGGRWPSEVAPRGHGLCLPRWRHAGSGTFEPRRLRRDGQIASPCVKERSEA